MLMPKQMLNEADVINIDRELAKRSLRDFIEMAWPVIDTEDYEHNWHMDAICDHLTACHTGEINRLLINVPPGTSKSSASAVYFPAWLWGPAAMPGVGFIGASYEESLAKRDNAKTRRLIKSDWYQARWPTSLTTDREDEFHNEGGGFRRSNSVTSMTGRRGHFVVWDDPHNTEGAESETIRKTTIRIFKETLTSRLMNPKKSTIIIIMQRLNELDVSGHILAADLGYHHLMLPMEFEPNRRCYSVVRPSFMDNPPIKARYDAAAQIWYPEGVNPPADRVPVLEKKTVQLVYSHDPRTEDGELLFDGRFPREVVERDKKAMGSYATAGQNQQRPSPRGGGMFKKDWFVPVRAAPVCVRYVRAWDVAASTETKSAYTVGLLMGITFKNEYVLIDLVRDQLSAGGVERLIKSTAAQDGLKYGGLVMGSIPQDPGAGGKAWAQSLVRAAAGYNYRKSPETGDKISRAEPFSAQAEAGNVMMVVSDWNPEYLDELAACPNGAFMDQVDASSRAFMELTKPQSHTLQGTYGQ